MKKGYVIKDPVNNTYYTDRNYLSFWVHDIRLAAVFSEEPDIDCVIAKTVTGYDGINLIEILTVYTR